MKALKEKRIGLRSLWRRGLVILSLFALVFASCSDSDDGGGDLTVTGGPEPYGITITTQPTNVSYMGLPLDLTGIIVTVRYTDGTVAYVKDDFKFTTEPRWATGFYDDALVGSANPYTAMTNYTLYYSDPKTNKVFQDTVRIPGVIPIYREDGSVKIDVPTMVDPVTGKDTGSAYVSGNVNLTGLATQGQKTMRVDDKPTFAGLTLEAWYRNRDAAGTYENSPPAVKKVIPFSLDDMEWRIVPYYDNGNETGTGAIYVTLGRNYYVYTDDITGEFKPDWGVVAIHPLEAVYHVTGIELAVEPTLSPFFYWQSDSSASWITRVRNGNAEIKVTYSDNSTRNFTVAEALAQNTVWLNTVPGDAGIYHPEWDSVGTDWEGVKTNAWVPFSVAGIVQSAQKLGVKEASRTFRKIPSPQIGFYYRGRRCYYDVPVYTTYQRLNVEILAGGDQITIDMTQTDNDYQGMTMASFAKLLKVSAVFTSPTVEEEAELVLGFKEAYSDTEPEGGLGVDSTVTMEGGDLYRSFYSMNFGIPNGPDAWGISSTVKNNGTKAVRINYYNQEPDPTDDAQVGITARRRYANVAAEWINVER
jgi:hypothetical protein